MRRVVDEYSHNRYGPVANVVHDLSWPDLQKCLDIDPSGRPRHRFIMSTGDPFSQVDTIARWLPSGRGLTLSKLPKVKFALDAEWLSLANPPNAKAAGLLRTAARNDDDFYAALGEVPDTYDEFAARAKDPPPLGEYFDNRKTIWISGRDDTPLPERTMVVVAHELEHAAAYQRFDNALSAETVDGQDAVRMLVEGDATLTMLRFRYAVFGAAPLLNSEFLGTTTSTTPAQRTSPSVAAIVTLPYSAGFAYACRLYVAGGWSAVNDAYLHPSRLTTSDILFARRAHVPIVAGPRPTGLDAWAPVGTADLSTLRLLAYLGAAHLADPLAAIRDFSGGWVSEYRRSNQTAVLFSLLVTRGNELCDAVKQWQRAVPQLAREGGVACTDHHVEFDIIHTPSTT